jgi:hypothetical protein
MNFLRVGLSLAFFLALRTAAFADLIPIDLNNPSFEILPAAGLPFG